VHLLVELRTVTSPGARFMLAGTASTIIGRRYQLLKELGHGGMGAVFQALDRLTGQEVALKRVYVKPTELRFASFHDATTSPFDLRLALAQEFRVMASLRHPNIASVLDYGFDDAGQPYITMELLTNAQSLFRATWKSDRDKASFLIQILQALAYLHRRGIIHRDLKPGNILVVKGQVRVLDFGLSMTREQIDPNPEIVAGTVDYIAPEVFLREPASESSDLYAVGVIGYELFVGRRPWKNYNTEELIHEIVTKTPDMDLVANKRIRLVLARLLSKTPDERYRDADEAIIALSEAIGQPAPAETTAIRESFLQAARFVGRDTELRLLADTLAQATQGQGSVWLIGGESGVGKTRLLDELRVQALVSGVLVLRGQNVSAGGSPYQMWRGALRWLCLLTDLDVTEASVLKPLVPDIDALLGYEVPEAPKANPLFVQERLLLVIENIFRRQKQPILLMLEDLHWAGSESLVLLKRLSEIVQELPLLVVCSYRDDERPELRGLVPNAQVLKLNRLDEHSIVELSAAILGEKGRQPELLSFLEHETEGNVFFLVEVVRALAERAGQLDHVGSMALPEHVFTGGVNQIIQHRLSRLPAEERPTLELAAVAGRELDIRVLQHLVNGNVDMERWLAICSNTALLEVQDGVWRFAHEKLRDGVLTDLPTDRRRALHRQIATAIETVYLYSPDYVPSVAYHWTMAGDIDKEAHYAALAGKNALNSGAYEEAAKSFQRALMLTEGEASAERKQADLKRQLGDAFLGLGQYEQAKQLYQESLDLLQKVDYRWGVAAALNELGNVSFLLEDYEGSQACFVEALKTAMGIRALPVAMASITGIASLLANAGQPEWALGLAAFVVNHSLTDRQTVYRAEQMAYELKSALSVQGAAEAEEKGKAANLNDIVKDLLGT
jgi:eukaryotic-like serine/threonine-protein kinase